MWEGITYGHRREHAIALLADRPLSFSNDGRSADIKARLRFLDAVVSGSESDAQEWMSPSGSNSNKGMRRGLGDVAAAHRVVQAAQGIMRQLGRTGAGTVNLDPGKVAGGIATSTSQNPGVSESAEGVPTGSLDEDEVSGHSEEEEDGDTSSTGLPLSMAPTLSLRDFRTAWTSQMAKEGLVGALVALAYPDRIAM